jgi:PKD repeat protein
VKFTSPGSYSITLTSGDSASPAGSATNTATVTVTNPPLSANAGGPYSGTASTAVSLTGSATGGTSPYSCAWTGSAAASFTGSGCTGTSVTYTAAGTYTVTLTVTDSASPAATATSTATVTIGSAGAVCQTDSASDAGFGAVPDPTGVYEITNACAQNLSGTSQVKITMDIAGMATENLIGGTIGSPAVSYEAFVDSVSRSWTAQHALGGAGWVLYHGTAVSSGSASSTSTTLTILIPYSEISASATYHATSFRVASALPVVGYTHINDGVVADQVPNTGSKTI